MSYSVQKLYNCFYICCIVLLLCSCHTPHLAYFQDLDNGQYEELKQLLEIRVRSDDKLSIVVSSRDPQLTSLFNLPYTAQRIGATTQSRMEPSLTINGNQGILCYTVDESGDIDFPELGRLHVLGMKREEIASYIKRELISRDLLKDPVVTVDFVGFYFNVLGEVNKPGRYTFDREHFTILDALGMAGDLTINGQRENVTVIREVGNQRVSYRVNLMSGQDLYNSPVYFLQQNDVVYVEPNVYRSRQSTVNENTFRSVTFWISLASFLTTVGVLIFK